MSVPSRDSNRSGASINETPEREKALEEVSEVFSRYKSVLVAARTEIISDTATHNSVLNRILSAPIQFNKEIDRKSVPLITREGIDFVSDRRGDRSYDLNVEITEFKVRTQKLIDWINTNYPRDSEGYYVHNIRIDPDSGKIQSKKFSGQEMNGLVPLINDVLNFVE